MATCRRLGPNDRELRPSEPVGVGTIADQFVTRCEQRGFVLNVMCIGPTACGKSTLLESLFERSFELKTHSHQPDTVSIQTIRQLVVEGDVEVDVGLVTSVGYGDQIVRTDSAAPIVSHLEEQFNKFLQEELKTKRNLPALHDERIHACIFMLRPTGKSLTSLDLQMLRTLQDKVNIIPVIAKADTITASELRDFKHLLRQEFEANKLNLYRGNVPTEQYPMAVIGSKDTVSVGGVTQRVRRYPWGVVEVTNDAHSDFNMLRKLLFRSCTEDLRDSTHRFHYEHFRTAKLTEISGGAPDSGDDEHPQTVTDMYEARRAEIDRELKEYETRKKDEFTQQLQNENAKVKQQEAEIASQRQALEDQYRAEMQAVAKAEEELQRSMQAFEEEKARVMREREEGLDKRKKKHKK
eukprot:TRINITY_DN5147_c0_g1_i2.p1 TRINITY_DN5147_c0_g1~~TRINITY_DN5147_c0_g1_i2.p1  ORF type:complete len:409 (+),score=116.38 TRINITY_DN5147_c0_g1_i2:73-1299(+)